MRGARASATDTMDSKGRLRIKMAILRFFAGGAVDMPHVFRSFVLHAAYSRQGGIQRGAWQAFGGERHSAVGDGEVFFEISKLNFFR